MLRSRIGRWIGLLAVASALVAGFPVAAQTVGIPWIGTKGVTETNDQINARSASAPVKVISGVRNKVRPDRRSLPQNPLSPPVASWPARSDARLAAPVPMSPQTPGIQIAGPTLGDTGSFPPDTMGAVGPTQFIVAVNGRIRTYSKATGAADGALNANTDAFFASVMTPPTADNFTTDPRIRYDRLSGRWFVVMIDVPGQAGVLPNRVMIAVSSGGTITGPSDWTFFQFQHDLLPTAGDTNGFADYPTLGIDANALYIGVNVFTAAGMFSNTTAFVVRKSSILGAGPIVATAFRGLLVSNAGPYTPQGVDNFDPAATEGYLIGVDNATFGTLMIRRITNPGGTPVMSGNISLTVPTTGFPQRVPHLGNTGGAAGQLDAIDDRLFAAHIRGGRLWTAHNLEVNASGVASGSGNRVGTRWYELSGIATGQTPAVVQSGTVFDSAATDPVSYWMPSIMVSGQGHAALGFSSAGNNARVNAATVGRLSGDAVGTMGTIATYTASGSAYNPPSDPGGAAGRRWGDYSYTMVDPDDDMTMWTIQQFCQVNNSYRVEALQLLAPPPATPVSCSPATVDRGATANVVVTATSTGGSGFFDPGAGFAKRIAASLSGAGITVNGVTYTDPTHVTINVTADIAAADTDRNVTVTNPDGQAATGPCLTGITPVELQHLWVE